MKDLSKINLDIPIEDARKILELKLSFRERPIVEDLLESVNSFS